MKIKASELNKHLPLLGRAVPSKTPLPILEYFSVRLVGSDLWIASTDNAVSASVRISGVEGDGKDINVAVPAKVIERLVPAFDNEELTLSPLPGDRMVFKSASSGRHEVKGLSNDMFPPVKTVADFAGNFVSIPKKELLTALKRVAFAVDRDNTEATAKAGLTLRLEKSNLTLEATDSLRLVQMMISVKNPDNLSWVVLLPPRAVGILDLLEDGELRLQQSETALYCSDTNSLITIQLLNHKPMDLGKIITSFRRAGIMYMNVAEIKAALARILAFGPVNVQWRTNGQGMMTLSAVSDSGDGFEDIQYAIDEGQPCKLEGWYSAAYLSDALAHVAGSVIGVEVCLSPNNENIPVLILRDEGWLHLLAPVVM